MNNHITIIELVVNTFIWAKVFKTYTKKKQEKMIKLEKIKKNLTIYIKKESIYKPHYNYLNDEEKKILAKVLLELKKNNKELYKFAQKVYLYTKKTNLRNMGNNFQTLKIRYDNKNIIKMILFQNFTMGTYNPTKNEIKINHNSKNTINHELLHAASSNPWYSSIGFNKQFKDSKKYDELGRGLNEGYTELLNNRLFKNQSFSYIFLSKISYLIELLFENKEEMKDYYFNNEIEGIIYELNKYISEEEIIELLIDIDKLYYDPGNPIKYFKIKRKILQIYIDHKKEDKNFEKEYHSNHLIKILKKKL